MIVYIVLILVFLCAYAGMPKGIQLILCLANIFIPDPIPFVDEVIMIAILLSS
jgi:hypothetical protein